MNTDTNTNTIFGFTVMPYNNIYEGCHKSRKSAVSLTSL